MFFKTKLFYKICVLHKHLLLRSTTYRVLTQVSKFYVKCVKFSILRTTFFLNPFAPEFTIQLIECN